MPEYGLSNWTVFDQMLYRVQLGGSTGLSDPLLSVEGLKVAFNLPEGSLEAVRGIDFRIPHGKTVALVGESGSGKSVVSQSIMGILPKSAEITGGKLLFNDPKSGNAGPVDIAQLNRDSKAMRALRGDRISIIFQEPMTSLSPVHTVGNQIMEALELHRGTSGKAGEEIIIEMLARVGFPDPRRALKTYPFELSGGLRQRAMIAMSLICHPALLIADEPTTALDVTIQAQILKLLKDLQEELGMAVLMITHDLGVVANLADEVVVMFRGEIMERGSCEDIFRNPGHPYLKALLKAVPRFDMAEGERLIPLREIKNDGPSQLMAQKEKAWPDTEAGKAPMLKLEGLTKRYNIRKQGFFSKGQETSFLAVDDVGFEVHRGECLGLVGESGCGKTTLSKMIMRALCPDEGKITFNDHGTPVDVLKLGDKALTEFRQRLQFMFQDPFLIPQPAHDRF